MPEPGDANSKALACLRMSVVMVLLLVSPNLAGYRASTTGRIDRFVRLEMERQQIPGLAIGVVKDGEVIEARGYGYSNVELRAPVSPETVFHAGSVGKQFTATAVMLLVQDGKLALDERSRTSCCARKRAGDRAAKPV